MAYGELQGKLWRSPSVRGLSDTEKLAWSYLLANKHSNMLGYYELPLSYMADDLEWSQEKAKKAIGSLRNIDLIDYDYNLEIMFIKKYLKYNHLSTGKREGGAIKRLEDIPNSPLLRELHESVKEWQPQLVELASYLQKEESSKSHRRVIEDTSLTTVIVIDKDKDKDKEESSKKNSGRVIEESSAFKEFWEIFKLLDRAEAKPLTVDHWNATIKGRKKGVGHPPVPAETIVQAAKNYRDYCLAEGKEREFIMQSASFVGPKKRGWETYLKPIKVSKKNKNGVGMVVPAKAGEYSGLGRGK